MNKLLTSVCVLLVAVLMSSCGSQTTTTSQRSVLRNATGITFNFEAREGMNLGDNSCKSPMIDPQDRTEITMVRSYGNGLGDYRVATTGKYGVGEGELLRINCSTGEAVGIVRE